MDCIQRIILRRRMRRRQLCLLALLAVREYLMKPKRRRYWVRPFLQKRKEAGDFYLAVPNMLKDDPNYFFETFRFTPAAFEEFLKLIGPLLTKKDTVREPIPEAERLMLTLGYLASGDMQKSIAKDYRVGRSTVCVIIQETCKAIITVLQPMLLSMPNSEDWTRISQDFHKTCDFPNCVGVIDGKHFAISKPRANDLDYHNYKGFFSLAVLASCDAKYQFTTISIGAGGSKSDGEVFGQSALGQKLLSSSLDLPTCYEDDNNILMPHVFVADETFPLLPNVMRPYHGDDLTVEQRMFNYRISRPMRVMENAFGVLVARWRVLMDRIYTKAENAENVIKACMLLHNYVCGLETTKSLYIPSGFVDYEDPVTREISRGHWRDVGQICNLKLQPHASNNYSQLANDIRDNFKTYFNTVEEV